MEFFQSKPLGKGDIFKLFGVPLGDIDSVMYLHSKGNIYRMYFDVDKWIPYYVEIINKNGDFIECFSLIFNDVELVNYDYDNPEIIYDTLRFMGYKIKE